MIRNVKYIAWPALYSYGMLSLVKRVRSMAQAMGIFKKIMGTPCEYSKNGKKTCRDDVDF